MRVSGRASAALSGLLLTAACSSGDPLTAPPSLMVDVDPRIGTGGTGFGVGSIPPGPAHPLGLARPGPDTSTNRGRAPSFSHCAGYWWEDDEIRAFSQIHLVGTGVPDYGAFGLMPVGALPAERVEPGDWRAGFEHGRESIRIGRYTVQLLPSGIGVDVAATARTALYALRYPAGVERNLVIDLAHGLGEGRTEDAELIASEDGREVTGWVHHRGMMSGRYGGFRLYFVLKVEAPFERVDAVVDGRRIAGVRTATGATAGAVLGFGSAVDVVRLQVGLSFVDEAGARANLEAEWADFDLDRAESGARTAWAGLLDRASVTGGRPEDRRIFASALFHAYGMPTVLSDVDGRYRGVDQQIARADGWTYYSDFSLWDTFRTQHPLIALLTPDIQADMNRSMWAMTEATGRVPKWPLGPGETDTMIAYHGESVLVDALLKGVSGVDEAQVYDALRTSAFRERPETRGRARDCASSYLDRGYCALDAEGGATSKTLEAAFSDFALAQLATHLGHTEDAARLRVRADGWRHLADPQAGLLRGRMSDGTFPEGFRDDVFTDDLVEGNARQWTVFVPQDVPGWAEALGGRAEAIAWLDAFFQNASEAEDTPLPDLWYWHGNEPDVHAPFMFAELDRPDLTRKWAAWVRDAKYTDGPEGLDGNDDGGTLSAWYVFAALGLFPKVAEARYVLSSPAFPRAQLELPGGTLVVKADNWSEGAHEVDEVLFDGEVIEGPFISHAQIARGGTLLFRMR